MGPTASVIHRDFFEKGSHNVALTSLQIYVFQAGSDKSLVVLGIEPRDLFILGKHSTAEL